MENLSYIHNPIKESFSYDTIKDRLKRYADQWPQKEAVVFYSSNRERVSLTFGELYEKSCECARGLLALGVKPGDIIGLGLPNTPEWLICHFGIIFAGAIALGFPYFDSKGMNIVSALRQSGKCTAIFFGPTKTNFDIIRNFVNICNEVGHVSKSDVSTLKFAIRVGDFDDEQFPFTLSSLLDLGKKNLATELPPLSADDVCIIVLSSGTTGNSKLIPKTHFHITCVKPMTNYVLQLSSDEILFSATPFTWIGGYVVSFLNFGHTLVTIIDLLKYQTARDFAEIAAEIIERENCSVAAMYGPALLEFVQGGVKCTKFPLRCVITGGFPLAKSYAAVVGTVTNLLVGTYGCTELGSVCYTHISKPEDFREYIAGHPVRGIELKVVDENGALCPIGTQGEIMIRSCTRFQGYVNDEEKTKMALDHSGWYKTNDGGHLCSDGQVIVTGRLSELMIIGGAKISPLKIEKVISGYPGVVDVVVVPIADDQMFQEACACIIKRPDTEFTWEAIKDNIEKNCIANKESLYFRLVIPKYHVFMDTFPKTSSGKVIKHLLIEQAKHLLGLTYNG